MVEKLCRFFGVKICEIEGHEYYDFPTVDSLCSPKVESILRQEGFGYRAAYVAKSAQKLLSLGGRDWLLALHKENGTTYESAKESLFCLPGVGPKVADCICLMSLGFLEAIPVDTHIYQVACMNYMPHVQKQNSVTPKIYQEVSGYLRELWGPLAGWAQAIVFCSKINANLSLKKTKKRLAVSGKGETAGTKTHQKKGSILTLE